MQPVPGRVTHIADTERRLGAAAVSRYVSALSRTDPLADAFAADCTGPDCRQLMRLFEDLIEGRTTLAEHPDAPASLVDLISQLRDEPPWLDREQIRRGQVAYSSHAKAAGIALGTASMVSGYDNAAASQPLIITGRFLTMARLRTYETSMWVFAVARPGGLERSADGFARTARVRMVHAFVRARIRSRGDWDVEALGAPINQADLAYTVVEFSLLPIRAMQRVGVHFTDGEIADMYAMWRYMGYLMGVDDQILPADEAQSHLVEDLHVSLGPGPSDATREYTAALLDGVFAVDVASADGALGLIGRRWGRELMHGLSRRFVGDPIADRLRIEDSVWQYSPGVVWPLNQVASRIVRRFPRLQMWQVRRSLAEVQRLLDRSAADLGISHDLVDHSPVS
ncbi:MAG: oxygenase MpaB family protein [Candidatus Nanopelagicales bacterium]